MTSVKIFLIVFMSYSHTLPHTESVGITVQEFDSMATCYAIKREIIDLKNRDSDTDHYKVLGKCVKVKAEE